MKKKRYGILTGGGDCPGLNTVIRAVTKTLVHVHNADVVGFEDGFGGLVYNNQRQLSYDDVSNILTQGGTILGTSNKDNLFGVKRSSSQRVAAGANKIDLAKATFKKQKLSGLICIGGDGTLTVANYLYEQGIPIVGVPKTIDNDVQHTDQTFGFDTACTVATEAIDRLHSTASSHKRVMIVEVMGRSAGWIALHAGIAGGGDIILLPEIPFNLASISKYVRHRFQTGRKSCIIVAAEGATQKGNKPIWEKKSHQIQGISQTLEKTIQDQTGIDCRATILGYVQRGGTPTPFDRVLATKYGHAAAELASQNLFGQMVALKNNAILSVPLNQVAGHPRRVSPESELVRTARDVGTSFGE